MLIMLGSCLHNTKSNRQPWKNDDREQHLLTTHTTYQTHERMLEPHSLRCLPAPDPQVPHILVLYEGYMSGYLQVADRLLAATSTDVVQNCSSSTQNSFTYRVRGTRKAAEI
jgi:hypothetical protein